MIYFFQTSHAIKIGYTNRLAENRLVACQTGNHEKITIAGVMVGDMNTEKELHRRFRRTRLHGEWFSIDYALTSYISRHSVPVSEYSQLERKTKAIKELLANGLVYCSQLPPGTPSQQLRDTMDTAGAN